MFTAYTEGIKMIYKTFNIFLGNNIKDREYKVGMFNWVEDGEDELKDL